MAAPDTHPPVQIANADLAVERQNMLRVKLEGYFAALSKRAKIRKRLVYTINGDESPLEKVVRMNGGADALFTSFAYDRRTSDNFKDSLRVDTPQEMLNIDPQLRYPLIAQMLKLVDQGEFRHRKLILVGDLHEKIGQFIRSALPVTVTAYTTSDRKEISRPIQITSLERIARDPEAAPAEGRPIPVGSLVTLDVADIHFDGVINMPEEGNRFVLKDQTLVDTARKLFLSKGLQAALAQEQISEEKLVFVRGKRVFIVLEPDLEHIISERFIFDKMENVYPHHTLEEAFKTLEGGKSEGILEYFEKEGYDIIFEVLDQDERDKLLTAVLGNKVPQFLVKEVETVKSMIGSLDDSDLESLFYNLPTEVVEQTLEGLKEKNYERFLSQIPPKMREGVILEFLRDPKRVRAAWQGIGAEEKKEILVTQAPLIHGVIYLLDSTLSKKKFPALRFDFERSYKSALLAKMNAKEQKSTLATIVRSIEASGAPKGLLNRQLEPIEIERFFTEAILRNPSAIYNKLNPGIRKQIWVTVGREFKDQISKKLHALDKIEILKGSKETSLELIFNNPAFMSYLKSGEDVEFSASLFLAVKKLNKAESKTALLKKVLTDPAWRPSRVKGVPALLTDPDNGLIFEKLSEHVEELEFKFDSLVCTRADYEALKDQEPLAGAVVTLVDDLVDPVLYKLFQAGELDREEYDKFSASVEQEISGLRREMAAREVDDPVGVYVLETMQTLNQLSNQVMSGGLNEKTLAGMDDRGAVRRRILDAMKAHVRRIDEFLVKAEKKLPAYDAKIAQLRQAADKFGRQYDQAYAKANALFEEFKKLQQLQQQGLQDRKKVALTQKELSVSFFELIQPLILDKVRSLGGVFQRVMRAVGVGGKTSEEGLEKRVIFKFSDEEIENILRYNIVFCSKDTILAQFIATCLRIDKLEDSLFKLATAENLPSKTDIDILFYGPGYSVDDFSGSLKENQLVAFADQDFHDRLTANEKLKARTKAALTKAEEGLKSRKPLLEKANAALKTLQSGRGKAESAAAALEAEKRKLRENFKKQKEKRHHTLGEMKLLGTRLAEIDTKYEELRSRIAQLVGGEGNETMDLLKAGKQEMAEQMRQELVALNKELARMMFIKGVKDAGDSISKNTQKEILSRVESREIYPYRKRPFKRLIVADDGTNTSTNMKRAFIDAAIRHFKLPEMGVQEVSINRLLSMAENGNGSQYPFVALISDKPADDYGELKLKVKKIRKLMPETYQLMITPFGNMAETDQADPIFRNLQSLKDNCTLVNASIGDFTDPSAMTTVLREKAPLG